MSSDSGGCTQEKRVCRRAEGRTSMVAPARLLANLHGSKRALGARGLAGHRPLPRTRVTDQQATPPTTKRDGGEGQAQEERFSYQTHSFDTGAPDMEASEDSEDSSGCN